MISTFPMTARDFLLRTDAGLTIWEQNEDKSLEWFGTEEQIATYEELKNKKEDVTLEF